MADRIIKRYSNRKLYDTTESRYVSLLELFEMVREGQTLKVVGSNNEDITTETLLSVLIERGKYSDAANLNQTSLYSVIATADGTIAGFINNSLKGVN